MGIMRDQWQQHRSRIGLSWNSAKGITAPQNSVTIDQAYQLLRGHARNNYVSLRVVAEAIVGVSFRSEPGGHPDRNLGWGLSAVYGLGCRVRP